MQVILTASKTSVATLLMQYLTAMILQIICFKSHTAQAEDFNYTSLSVTCCPSLSGLPSSCFQGATEGTTFLS